MKITITGLDEVLKKLDRAKNVDKPIMDGLYEAMQEAQNIAMEAYAWQGGENEDYDSYITEKDNGYVLTMSGEDVGFLEFGVGIMTTADEFADEVDFDVSVGSYSKFNQGQFERSGYRFWWYEGVRYKGLLPTRGMQRALDFLRNNLMDIVERKCKEWIES